MKKINLDIFLYNLEYYTDRLCSSYCGKIEQSLHVNNYDVSEIKLRQLAIEVAFITSNLIICDCANRECFTKVEIGAIHKGLCSWFDKVYKNSALEVSLQNLLVTRFEYLKELLIDIDSFSKHTETIQFVAMANIGIDNSLLLNEIDSHTCALCNGTINVVDTILESIV